MAIRLRRREFLAAAGAAAGSSVLPFRPALAASTEILWSTWNNLGLPDYIDPFTKDTGIKVDQTYITTDDEQFAKFKAGGAADVDVVVPGQWEMSRYIASDLVQPLDLKKIPNAAHMYPVFRDNPINKKDGVPYALPYYWGINTIVYRADLMDEKPDWSVFFKGDKYKGKLAMRDYAVEGIMIAALYLGIPQKEIFSMDDRQLAECKTALIAEKKLLRTYWTSIADLTNLYATGEVVCAFSWLPPYYDLSKRGIKMALSLPKEGVPSWCDVLAIPTGVEGEKLEAAYKFINYLLGPEYGLKLAYGGPYAQSTDVVRDKLPPEQQERIFIKDLAVMDSFVWPQIPRRYNEWVTMWNEVKAS